MVKGPPATLLCCLQGEGASLPQQLLQELIVGMLQWELQDRCFAHSVLAEVLTASGLREQQAHALLSAVWHQV